MLLTACSNSSDSPAVAAANDVVVDGSNNNTEINESSSNLASSNEPINNDATSNESISNESISNESISEQNTSDENINSANINNETINNGSISNEATNELVDSSDTSAEAEPLQQADQESSKPLLDSTDNIDLTENEAAFDEPVPVVRTNTDVAFEITVPAYQSKELQLRLTWGEYSTSLNWISDEFWSVDAVLPANTEHLLTIVFFDENGDIELGSFEQLYRTGVNAMEVFQASADQFDTNRWDLDGDSVSNLDELIAGTDPRLVNGALDDMPDPMVQNNIDVTFEVTVPAYQSKELKLQLTWGEFSTSLNWVGDEFWSVDAVLPTSTERFLSIVFFDENGDIELASFEQQYKSGINAAEVFQVNADQFDTNRWDLDGDGTSNLDELIEGTDPRVEEVNMVFIADEKQMSLLFIANYFENEMPGERPYMGTEDNRVSVYEGSITIADIDSNGSGQLFHRVMPEPRHNIRSAERLVTANTVQWSGSWGFTDDFSLSQKFTSEVSVDGDMRRLVEQGSGSWVGTYSHRWETTVDVTGELIEGTDYCRVATGRITESYTRDQDGSSTITIARKSGDEFWRVLTNSGESFYYVRELSMHMIRFGYQNQVSEHDYFFCNFDDLK